MKLENLLTKGKRFLRNSLIYSSIPLMIACSSGGNGGGNSGSSSKDNNDNGDDGSDENPPEDDIATHETYAPSEKQLEIVLVEGNVWYFSEPVTFKEGDIIGFGLSDNPVVLEKFPYGFLKRVKFVSDDEMYVEVENGTLEEAVANSIASNQLRNQNQNYLQDVSETFNLGQFSAQFEDMDLGYGATLSGGIYFNVNANLDMDFDENGLQYFSFEPFINEDSNLEAVLISAISGMEHEIEFVSYPLSPFTVPIPGLPFPAVVFPILSLNVGVQGNLAPVTTSIRNDADFSPEISYNGGWGFKSTFINTLDLTPPTLFNSLDFVAYMSPIAKFLFYGVAGPYARANIYARAVISDSSWQIHAGLTGEIGVKAEMISKTLLDYSKEFQLYEKILDFGAISSQGTLTDSRDGKIYDTVRIGTQWWMVENLNYNSSNSYCYNNSSSNCNVYGRLYSWNAAVNACPSGWHLPSTSGWNILTEYLGGNPGNAGGKLKEAGTSHWLSPNSGATNESGFTALPGGIRYSNGTYEFNTQKAYFWSSTETSSTTAFPISLYYNLSAFGNEFSRDDKVNSMSVRCIKD